MSAESDLYKNLLDQLQACATQEERDWLALRFTLDQLPKPLRAAVQAAAVPRFFDRAFLNALLDQPLDEAQFAELTGLSYIEPYPGEGRFNVHERSRKLLQEKLWQEDEALYREISRRVFAYCAKQDQNDLTWVIEMMCHRQIAEPEEGKIVLNITEEEGNKNREELLVSKEKIAKIIQIRHVVTKLWQSLEKDSMPYYMPHGPAHATSVEDMLHRLIPGELYKRLSEIERYYLLVAAWTHDIGMISGNDVGNEGKLPPAQIREDYHQLSEQYIVNNYNILEIDEKDSLTLGLLAFFHSIREDLENCPELFVVGNENVRLRLLAAYLRLANALDVGQSRAPSSEYAICFAYDITSTSKLHWIKSRLVNGIAVLPSQRRIVVHFKQPHENDLERKIPQEDDRRFLQQHLACLQQSVLDELKEVLDSVKNTMIRGGITWYLDIESVSTEMVI